MPPAAVTRAACRGAAAIVLACVACEDPTVPLVEAPGLIVYDAAAVEPSDLAWLPGSLLVFRAGSVLRVLTLVNSAPQDLDASCFPPAAAGRGLGGVAPRVDGVAVYYVCDGVRRVATIGGPSATLAASAAPPLLLSPPQTRLAFVRGDSVIVTTTFGGSPTALARGTPIVFSPTGAELLTLESDSVFHRRAVTGTGDLALNLQESAQLTVLMARWDTSGIVVLLNDQGVLRVRNALTAQQSEVAVPAPFNPVAGGAFSPDGRRAAVWSRVCALPSGGLAGSGCAKNALDLFVVDLQHATASRVATVFADAPGATLFSTDGQVVYHVFDHKIFVVDAP